MFEMMRKDNFLVLKTNKILSLQERFVS